MIHKLIQIEAALKKLREAKPLVLNLTNYVTMDFMANVLLALGAAPIMTVCDEELEELIKISGGVNINIGTLDKTFIEMCHKTISIAKCCQKPVVLDPVGAGCTNIRTQTAKHLLEHVNIVRGNASEILSLADSSNKTHGVESTNSISQAKDKARELASRHKITVVVSGPIDFITNGNEVTEVPFGSASMQQVTGMGCTLTAVIAAFKSVIDDSFVCAQLATIYFGLCGQLTAEFNATFPGEFRTAFIDALHKADFDKMRGIIAE